MTKLKVGDRITISGSHVEVIEIQRNHCKEHDHCIWHSPPSEDPSGRDQIGPVYCCRCGAGFLMVSEVTCG